MLTGLTLEIFNIFFTDVRTWHGNSLYKMAGKLVAEISTKNMATDLPK